MIFEKLLQELIDIHFPETGSKEFRLRTAKCLMQSRLAGYARTEILKVSVDTINGERVIILEDGDNGENET